MTERNETIVESGTWTEKIKWELYESIKLPPSELCTAVFCVAMTGDDVVLTRVARGWEILGGHIEDSESIVNALIREAQEEGGFTPTNYEMFAYKKIISTEPMPHQNPTKMYPFPVGYIPYFLATSDQPIGRATGEEVFESRIVSLNEAQQLVDPAAWTLIALANEKYKLKK
jgi:8-oxo-dGTP pyrophosphatase MutT (NUDIX family)